MSDRPESLEQNENWRPTSWKRRIVEWKSVIDARRTCTASWSTDNFMMITWNRKNTEAWKMDSARILGKQYWPSFEHHTPCIPLLSRQCKKDLFMENCRVVYLEGSGQRLWSCLNHAVTIHYLKNKWGILGSWSWVLSPQQDASHRKEKIHYRFDKAIANDCDPSEIESAISGLLLTNT